MTEFPGRNWSLASEKRLLQQIDMTGSADRKSCSGRRRSACRDHPRMKEIEQDAAVPWW